MMQFVFTLSISLLLLSSCKDSNKQPDTIHPNWWLGNWEMKTDEGLLTESWARENDSVWKGSSYFITPNGDTPSYETIQLIADNDTLFYIPTVSNQNKGTAIRFKEITQTDSSIVFENPAHDFPQRIGYIKTSDTTIHAYIEGMNGGANKTIDFYYTKKK